LAKKSPSAVNDPIESFTTGISASAGHAGWRRQLTIKYQAQWSRMMRSKTFAMLFAIVFVSAAIGSAAQSTPSRSLLALSKHRDPEVLLIPLPQGCRIVSAEE
jgi:hypothetical protein